MRSYIYGVEKACGNWVVWRFDAESVNSAVTWLTNGARVGRLRWLCDRSTAAGMTGEKMMDSEHLIIWGD